MKNLKKTMAFVLLGATVCANMACAAELPAEEQDITNVPAEVVEAVGETTNPDSVQADLEITEDGTVPVEADAETGGYDDQIMPISSRHYYNDIDIEGSYPSGYTVKCNNITWEKYATILVSGKSYTAGIDFKAEVYKESNGKMVRVGSYSMSQDKSGNFSFEHPIGADGNYAIKIRHTEGNNVVATVDLVVTY